MSSSGHVKLHADLLAQSQSHDNFFYLSNWFEQWNHVLHLFTLVCIAIFFLFIVNEKNMWRIDSNSFFYGGKILLFVVCADSVTTLFFIMFKSMPWITLPLPIGFFITMCLLISLRWCLQAKVHDFSIKNALTLGAVQGFALLPGISRYASVFVASRWLGFDARDAFIVSWVVQIPLIIGALGKSSLFFFKHPDLFPTIDCWFVLVLVGATSGAFFLLALSYYMAIKNKWWFFGIYMIVPFVLSVWMSF